MLNNKVTIFDVSFWQDDDTTPRKIDFNMMKSQGGDGVILRAGQNSWLDEDYVDYARAADQVGLPRGAYWFYDSRTSPVSQAELFCDIVEMSGFPPLGIWGDYEERYGGSWKGERNFLTFLNKLKERFPGKLVGVYTGPAYWIEFTTAAFRSNFGSFPLWIAHYGVSNPLIPAPWTNYVFWQYTDSSDGYRFGVESRELDTNVFGGTLDDYRRYFLLDNYIPGEPQQGDEGMFKVWSDKYIMSLRQDRTVLSSKVDSVPVNTVMIADRIEAPVSGGLPTDLWAHVVSINGVTKDVWVAVVHLGIVYCNTELIPDTATGLPAVLYIATKEDMSDKAKYIKEV